MIFPQTAHAFNPDDVLSSASHFQSFPDPILLEAANVPLTTMSTLLNSKVEQGCVINGE
jgi:hypothetical protein